MISLAVKSDESNIFNIVFSYAVVVMIVLYAIKVMIAIVLIPMELIRIFYDYQLNLKFNFIIQYFI